MLLFVLSYSEVLVFFFIIYLRSQLACYLTRVKKGVGLYGSGGGEQPERREGREIAIMIYYMTESRFFNKNS